MLPLLCNKLAFNFLPILLGKVPSARLAHISSTRESDVYEAPQASPRSNTKQKNTKIFCLYSLQARYFY